MISKINLIREFITVINPNQAFFRKKIEYTAVNTFCWKIRDRRNILFEKDLMEKQNRSNKEKKSFKSLDKKPERGNLLERYR